MATVLEVEGSRPYVRVRLALASGDARNEVRARLALAHAAQGPFAYVPREGDAVLVLGDASRADGCFVVGVLSALREVEAPGTLAARSGARASLERSGAGDEARERLCVRDAAGALLFEYEPETKRSVVHVSTGDLALRVAEGALEVYAAKGLRVESPTAHARFEAASLEAHTLETVARVARTVVSELEVSAEQLVERVRNAYREASELSQTRAGRLRLLAETTAHLLGARTFVKAEHDVKILGDEIHLG